MIGILSVVLGLLEVWLTKALIDVATAGAVWQIYAMWLVVCMVLNIGLGYALRWIKATLTVQTVNRWQAQRFNQLLTSEWIVLRKLHSGTSASTLTSDLEVVARFVSDVLPSIITDSLQFVGAFIFLCIMDWRLALAVMVVTPVLIAVAQIYLKRMRDYRLQYRDAEANVLAYISESLRHSLLVKALERIGYSTRELELRQSRMEQTVVRTTRYSATAMLLVRLAFATGYLMAFFWGTSNLAKGIISFGSMVAFIQLVGLIQSPLQSLANYISSIASMRASMDRLDALPHSSTAITVATRRGESLSPITISDISFTFPDAQDPVLHHLSAVIPTGSLTAVVGETGIGKTTFVQILLGLLHPTEGKVLIPEGGFAYVPQGNTLFSGTVRENLRMGSPDATDEQMQEVLRLAHADFAGLDYSCGEHGTGLSEGQAQRVAIARALLMNKPTLLLDEAFSALDTETAVAILRDVRAARPKQTIICITHREAIQALAEHTIRLS